MDRHKSGYQKNYYHMVIKPRRLAKLAGGDGHDLAGLLCQYCGHQADAWDHIHPFSKGGESTVPACNPCNLSKGQRDVEQWRLQLARNKSNCPYFTPAQKIYLESKGFNLDASLDKGVVFFFEGGPGEEVRRLVKKGATSASHIAQN